MESKQQNVRHILFYTYFLPPYLQTCILICSSVFLYFQSCLQNCTEDNITDINLLTLHFHRLCVIYKLCFCFMAMSYHVGIHSDNRLQSKYATDTYLYSRTVQYTKQLLHKSISLCTLALTKNKRIIVSLCFKNHAE